MLSDSGDVTFSATVTGPAINGTNNSGIWSGPPGQASVVAQTGDQVPGVVGEVFWGLGHPVSTPDGDLAFVARNSRRFMVVLVMDKDDFVDVVHCGLDAAAAAL